MNKKNFKVGDKVWLVIMGEKTAPATILRLNKTTATIGWKLHPNDGVNQDKNLYKFDSLTEGYCPMNVAYSILNKVKQ